MAPFASRLDALAREGWRTYQVAQDVAGAYAGIGALVGAVKIGGVTTLVAAALAPAGFVIALVLVPLWPWVFVLPALLVAIALAAAAFTTYVLFRALPRAARGVVASLRAVQAHAAERYDELRALANGHAPAVGP